MSDKEQNPYETGKEFADLGDGPPDSLLAEVWFFLSHNKKWWLAPIFIVLGLAGLLVVLSATGAAPFIYALF